MGSLPAVPREQSVNARRGQSIDSKRSRREIPPRETDFGELLNQFRDAEDMVVKKKDKPSGRSVLCSNIVPGLSNYLRNMC